MNVITVAGNVGKDPEQRFLPDGTAVLSFSVADNQGRDKPAIWWSCSLFGKRAESLAQYITKGQPVTVTGTVTEREYTDKNGQQRKGQDVRVQDIALQGGRQSEQTPAQRPERAPAPRPTPAPATSGFDDMDSDIPY